MIGMSIVARPSTSVPVAATVARRSTMSNESPEPWAPHRTTSTGPVSGRPPGVRPSASTRRTVAPLLEWNEAQKRSVSLSDGLGTRTSWPAWTPVNPPAGSATKEMSSSIAPGAVQVSGTANWAMRPLGLTAVTWSRDWNQIQPPDTAEATGYP